jgi:hypothetical protein
MANFHFSSSSSEEFRRDVHVGKVFPSTWLLVAFMDKFLLLPEKIIHIANVIIHDESSIASCSLLEMRIVRRWNKF